MKKRNKTVRGIKKTVFGGDEINWTQKKGVIMTLFKENLQEILNYYEGIQKSYSNFEGRGPEGVLQWQDNHGVDQFLHCIYGKGQRQRTIITKDVDLQKALAQKEFARRSLEILNKDIEVLRQAINSIQPFDPNEILKSMGNGYQKLPTDYFFNPNKLVTSLNLNGEIKAKIDRHREWGRQPYKQSAYREEEKTNRTSKGLLVRSKSEVLIIEMLYKWYDMPHRYEQERTINGIIIAPDLTFEDAFGELFYWEHLGMMDVPEYAERNFRKLKKYYDVGLIPGDNLILSFDRQGKIDMSYIDSIIKYQVIPRL